jgi:hypothetical protein
MLKLFSNTIDRLFIMSLHRVTLNDLPRGIASIDVFIQLVFRPGFVICLNGNTRNADTFRKIISGHWRHIDRTFHLDLGAVASTASGRFDLHQERSAISGIQYV